MSEAQDKDKKRQSKYIRPALDTLPRYIPDDIDVEILHTVHTNREATAEIIWLYNGHSLQTIQRRLTALWQHHYLDRWSQIDRRGQRGGSDKQVYFLDTEGAKLLSKITRIRVRPYNFRADEGKYHLAHRIGARRIGALAFAACVRHPKITLAYDYPDKKFRVDIPGPAHDPANRIKINPDRFFGLQGCFENNPEQPLSLDEEKSILQKLRSYVLFKKYEPHISLKSLNDYPEVRDLNNFLVLIVCDGHSQTQTLNLMATARNSFGTSTPLRCAFSGLPGLSISTLRTPRIISSRRFGDPANPATISVEVSW
jgi:hypothetical protein